MDNLISKAQTALQNCFKTKNYYSRQVMEEEQFNEFIDCIQIDNDSKIAILDENNNLREKIFNLVCNIMIKKRDAFLTHVSREFSVRQYVRKSIIICIIVLILNTAIISFVHSFFRSKNITFQFSLKVALKLSFWEMIQFFIMDLIMYRFVYKKIKRRIDAYSYIECDNDIKEYYETEGENVYGKRFLSASDDNADLNIQIFKNKLSNELIGTCVLKPLVITEEKVVIPIGFIGTLSDDKLKFTILNKMVDTMIFDYELLKEAHVGKKVEIELITRYINFDLLRFLTTYKGFKLDKMITNDYKFYRGFNMFRFTKSD